MGMTGWVESASQWPALQLAAGALVASVWQGLLLTVAIGACVKLAPRTAAATRFLIWMAVFGAIALLPVLSILASPKASSSPQFALNYGIHALQLDARWALAIVALWVTFVLVRGVGLARSAYRLRSIWKRSIPIAASAEIEALLSGTTLRDATLCGSPEVDQPCVIGFFAPRILIPDWLPGKATASELEQIVLHEVSHLRRFDDWINLAQKLALICFPLNPALAWVERRLCAERELACDESVVRATQAPREYAACLANLAEQRLARRRLALSLGAWERRTHLAGRIESILRGDVALNPLRSRAVMAALVFATAGGAIELGGASQLVSFASPLESAAMAQSLQGSPPANPSRDVVYRPKLASARPVRSELVSNPPIEPATQTRSRQPAHQAPRFTPALTSRRAKSSADGVDPSIQSLIIVTHWQTSAGEQVTVTVMDRDISAHSAVRTGWFAIKL